MGVRGTARREQKPRAKLGKPVMNPYPFAPDPSPSITRPALPHHQPPTPTPPTPPPLRAAQLRKNLHSDTPPPASSRNLLISPVKSETTAIIPQTTRQSSSRVATNPQKLFEQQHDPHPDQPFTVEFRVYPFPPSSRPLSYPLNQASHFTASHPDTHSLHPERNEALRKLLLKRWRHDVGANHKLDIPSTIRDTPSDASQRRLTPSPRATQKRKRSPPPIDESDDDDIPIIHTMSGVLHSTASAPFDLDEGDPVLPMLSAGRTVEVTSNGSPRKPSRGDSTEFAKPENHDRHAKYARTGDIHSPKRTPAYYQPITTQQPQIRPWIAPPARKRNKRKTIEDGFPGTTHEGCSRGALQEASSDEIISKPPVGSLRAMKNRIYALKDQRRLLEQRELDEIVREAAQNSSVTVTKEDRIRLKEEIETLSKQAVRDVLRLISRRMHGLESSPQAEVKEVKLSLDMLPADLTKELKLMVLREKGHFALPASGELQKVRSELRDAVREYRRQRGLADL